MFLGSAFAQSIFMMVHSRLALTTGYNERGAENPMERPVAYLILIREFLGPSPSALSGKKLQSTGTYTNDVTLRSGFFPRNALGDGPAF